MHLEALQEAFGFREVECGEGKGKKKGKKKKRKKKNRKQTL